MTSVPPETIISGVNYAVRAVNGRPPQRDGDFDGQISLSLVYSSGGSVNHHEHTIQGLGLVCDGGIFVNEKDGRSKDRRRWRVQHEEGTERYVARQGLF